MITEIKELMDLVSKAEESKEILESDIEKYIEADSDDYDELVKLLESKGIIIKDDLDLDDEDEEDELESDEEFNEGDLNDENDDEDFENFLGDLENDPEFTKFSNEIENELIKNKDIEDLVISSSSSSYYADDPIKIYLSEIGQIPLLTTIQEIDLSRQVQDGLLAADKIKAYENKKIELSEEELKEANDLVEAGFHARDVLVESNLRLVVSIAKRYLGRGMKFQDLIQEGNMGLLKAVNKFDPQKGFRFSTYATWWIKQSITRAIADQARTIRVPVYMYEIINRLVRTQRKLSQELQREPTAEELALELHMSLDKVQEILKTAQDPISFDTPVGEEEDSTLGDFIHDNNMPNPLDYTINESFKEEIDNILKTLTPREEMVLRLRFGLVDGKAHTLEDVGREFGVTRERIRQIESKAIRRLRNPNRRNILSQYHGE